MAGTCIAGQPPFAGGVGNARLNRHPHGNSARVRRQPTGGRRQSFGRESHHEGIALEEQRPGADAVVAPDHDIAATQRLRGRTCRQHFRAAQTAGAAVQFGDDARLAGQPQFAAAQEPLGGFVGRIGQRAELVFKALDGLKLAIQVTAGRRGVGRKEPPPVQSTTARPKGKSARTVPLSLRERAGVRGRSASCVHCSG